MSFIDELEYRFRELNEALSFLLAILSLAVAFFPLNPIAFGISLLTATTAIVPHELAHRQSARNYGCNSRFVLSFKGFLATLIINLISGIFNIGILVFVAGYTAIMCRFGLLDRDIEGKTAFAGPATNLVIAVISLFLYHLIRLHLLSFILAEIAAFNSYVAFFNLIPIPPLDGFKIIRWNRSVWIVAIAFAIILTFFVI